MDVDPNLNCVAFQIQRWWKREVFVEQTPTRAEDGIRRAWSAVQAKTRARPAQVRAIYSEWEPSAHDQAFLAATFPKAEFTYSFSRPATADGWDAALAAAGR